MYCADILHHISIKSYFQLLFSRMENDLCTWQVVLDKWILYRVIRNEGNRKYKIILVTVCRQNAVCETQKIHVFPY